MAKKLLFSVIALALLVPAIVQASTSAKETVEVVTLQPNEKKQVTLEATEKTALGWGHASDGLEMSELSKKCKNNCINMTNDGNGREMASMYGGSFRLEPKDGKVSVTFQNVETFPIKIAITKSKVETTN